MGSHSHNPKVILLRSMTLGLGLGSLLCGNKKEKGKRVKTTSKQTPPSFTLYISNLSHAFLLCLTGNYRAA